MKSRVIWALAIVLVIAIAAFIPTKQHRVLSRGIDDYNAHRMLFGNRVFAQEFIPQGTIIGIGGIFVDLKGVGATHDVYVSLFDAKTNEKLADGVIPATSQKDDVFAETTFSTPVSTSHLVRAEFTAPDASKDDPLGFRYNPGIGLPTGKRLENAHEASGAFAISVTENAPLWQFTITVARNNPEYTKIALKGFGISLLVLLGIFLPTYIPVPTSKKRIVKISLLILLAVSGVIARFHVASSLGGVSGGDPYNYLFISQAIRHGENPFAGVKRLPGYPLLLAPTLSNPNIDDIVVMRSISIASAALSM